MIQELLDKTDKKLDASFYHLTMSEEAQPHELIKEAMMSLWWSCCQDNKVPQKLCEQAPRDRAHSLFIFDHLVDVRLRYLDGEWVYGNTKLADEAGKGWREYLDEVASKAEGAIPQDVQDHFLLVWWETQEPLPYKSTRHAPKRCDQFDSPPASWMSLRMKYVFSCDIAYCLYEDIKTKHYQAYYQDNLVYGYNGCQKLIKQRVQQEIFDVQTTLTDQGNKFSHRVFDKYAKDYFVGNRFARLLKKFTDSQVWFEIVNRKVVEGTKQCSM